MPVTPARRATARLLLTGLLATSVVPLSAAAAGPAAAQTAAPAPSAAGKTVLVTSGSYAQGTSTVVFGEVRNDWSRVSSNNDVTIERLDASGGVIDEVDALVNRTHLAPGETSSFRTFDSTPAGYASFRVKSIERSAFSDAPNHRFEVTVTGVSATAITGTVKNLNTAPAGAPEVELFLRDDAGTLYDVATTFVRGSGTGGAVLPQETVPFTEQRFSSDPFRSGTTVTAQAESFSDPSPFPTQLGLSVPKSVSAGQAGRVTIRVVGAGATSAAPAGIKVQLYGREARQTAFKLLRTVTTTGSSEFSFELKPQRDIRWQARVPAASNAEASVSGFTLTQVAFGVSSTGSTTGTGGTLRGGVRPASGGSLVHLQQQVGGVFRTVASTRLSSSSTYSFNVVKPRGRYVYRVFKPAVTGNQAGYGPVLVYSVF